jgi:hypothetical protein
MHAEEMGEGGLRSSYHDSLGWLLSHCLHSFPNKTKSSLPRGSGFSPWPMTFPEITAAEVVVTDKLGEDWRWVSFCSFCSSGKANDDDVQCLTVFFFPVLD